MEKGKKTYFWGMFGFFPKMRTFMKNSASSVFDPWDPITSCEISKKSDKTLYLLRSKFNYHVLEVKHRFQKKFFRIVLADKCYVSLISDRFLVRSVTIRHVLQSNGNGNVVGSIRHDFCFHLERYDMIIKSAYTSYILTFPSNQ